ncbi:hypothetical protein HanRHA438_Chr14g0643151 [Helianthus annuus]|nr:hypothetical protein HanRHA438_Chr14g0643151 [Helianthus annuus]
MSMNDKSGLHIRPLVTVAANMSVLLVHITTIKRPLKPRIHIVNFNQHELNTF